MDELLDKIFYEGPKAFTRRRLERVNDLFAQRLALLFTPTEAIPSRFVGKGPLHVIIPLPLPSIFDLFFRTGYDRPKLWLDLLQRATGKIRWMFMRPARVTVIKFDSYDHGPGNRAGYKALQDALKVCTYGRRDKRRLFYFGAIYDDNPDDLLGYDPNFVWKRTKHPRNAKIEVRVEEA